MSTTKKILIRERICLLILLLLIAASGTGQDLHFTQFNENPSLVNPALTGAVYPVRLSATYREQWRSVGAPFKTFGISAENRFSLKKEGASTKTSPLNLSRFGAGLAFYRDRSGDGNLGHTRVNLSLSTFIQSGTKSFLSMGIQAAAVQRGIDQSKLIFPNQISGSLHDPSLNSNENLNTQNFVYPDFSAGFLWSYSQDESRIAANDHLKANAGFSVFHLNRPTTRYLSAGNTNIRMRYVFHGEMVICKAQSTMAWAPTLMVQFQGTSKEIMAGLVIKKFINDKSKYTGYVKLTSLNYGLYFRNSDALAFLIMYEKQEQFAIGITYDVNISQLSAGSGARGGPEIVLRYSPAKSFLYKDHPLY
jgi:type IX secretion system PorP/SprF family membrane protein